MLCVSLRLENGSVDENFGHGRMRLTMEFPRARRMKLMARCSPLGAVSAADSVGEYSRGVNRSPSIVPRVQRASPLWLRALSHRKAKPGLFQ